MYFNTDKTICEPEVLLIDFAVKYPKYITEELILQQKIHQIKRFTEISMLYSQLLHILFHKSKVNTLCHLSLIFPYTKKKGLFYERALPICKSSSFLSL